MGSRVRTMDVIKGEMPFEEEEEFVLGKSNNSSKNNKDVVGLVLVDILNGFCTVGSGNLVCIYIYIPPF